LLALAVGLAGAAGCSTDTGPTTSSSSSSTPGSAAAQSRTDIEAALECYLVDNSNYSEGTGSTARDAVDDLTRWYPPINRTEEWSAAPRSGAGSSTWLLFASDGRGYGTATVLQPDPVAEEFVATVGELCVAALTPAPSDLTYPTGSGGSPTEALADPVNAEFASAMTTAIVGLPEDSAADALRAAGWRVRVGERDGVVQQNVGSAPTWVNLVITDGLVIGFTIG
jgi:hypothetical protein